MDPVASWAAILRETFADRRVVLVGSLATAKRDVDVLRELGVLDVLLVGYGESGSWTGPLLRVPRPAHGLLALSDDVAGLDAAAAAVASFDPAGEALVVAPPAEHHHLWGRRTIGYRAASWRAVEDKTVIDALWDAAGITRAPSKVVPADPAALVRASNELDVGAGTVWSGDPSQGPADSAALVYWVTNAAQAALATTNLTCACDRVRVMPFLEGISCSIHALVTGTGTAVFRPVEIITLRRPDGRFLYAGTSTSWDPSPEHRAEMRAIARRVAAHLRTTLDYRGPFGIDGILTQDGFIPTELNSRWTAGFWPLAMPCSLPLNLLANALSSGLEGPMPQLETSVSTAADATRWGGPTLTGQHVDRTGRLATRLRDGRLEPCADTDATVYVAVTGDSTDATVLIRPAGKSLQGESLAALAVAGFQLADEHLGSAIGPTQHA